MKSWSFVLALFVSSCAFAQKASPVLGGTWTATAGPTQIFRGTWSGQTSPNNRNAAVGSWILLNEPGDEILMQGTWSAHKVEQGWRGTWTAKVLNGQAFSGTWSANMAAFNGKTIEEMLERTAAKEVAGWWRSGSHKGNWYLKSSPAQGRSGVTF